MQTYMAFILGIMLSAAVIMILEVPYMLRKRLRKELWVFSILLLLGVGISSAKSLQWTTPTPLNWITAVYKPFTDFLTHIGLIK
ncbi:MULTISPECIES: hypothetical protein [unclassified Paenibacillus]|uniref:hypothetical protein n=1 Tax=unclassified Paenibacillus TaxID=185978 RepID=UPI001CEFE4A0|nr:hypothetical protein [Paenibacillus sp. BJ-4]